MNSTAILASAVACTVLGLAGCGGGGDSGPPPPPVFSTQIMSDQKIDGDIDQTGPNSFTITQGDTEFVLAGIAPDTLNESRAFLDFPLTGANGIPTDAIIN